MSNGIPKSARDVLAKQTAADAHLSADLLNAYVEQSLTDAEKQQVTLHLASCADCREVVFLAGAAVEELEPALVAAAPPPRTMQQMAVPAKLLQHPDACAVLQPRAKPPKVWWRWALPLTAVVIVGAVVLVERDHISGRMSSPPVETAPVRQVPVQPSSKETPSAATSPEASPAAAEDNRTPSRADSVFLDQAASAGRANQQAANRIDAAKRAQAAKVGRDQGEQTALQTQPAPRIEGAHSNALAATAAVAPPANAKPAAPPSSTSQSAEVASAAPLVHSDSPDLSSNAAPDLKAQPMAKSLTGDQLGALTTLEMERSPAPARTRWRISKDGHVEHTAGPSTWERVMAAEPVNFRVVATIGNSVWAGGNDGALFHSSDGGKHWDRVGLAGEQGAITSIHFSTAQQGSLTSDSGATWTTMDGGLTWSKQ